MPTLHNATEETKSILKYLGISIVGLFLIITLFNIGRNVKEYFFPTPPPPPTVSFGKLPSISFPKSETPQKFTYSLNTVSGSLSVFPDRATIYKVIKTGPNLLALKNAQAKVSSLGFESDGISSSEDTYIWQSTQFNLFRKLTLNILSYNFTLTSDFLSTQAIVSGKNVPDGTTAIQAAESFLGALSSVPNDIDSSKTQVTPFAIIGNQLIKTTSLSNAQVVRVDFFQKNVNSLPVVYPFPPDSTMNFFIGGGTGNGQAVQANFFHQGLTEISATYPIKTAEEAFADLKNTNAYIAALGTNKSAVEITNVYLAYYASDQEQAYLMPIVVFEGANNFKAYVSAVKNNWTN